jgi:hypothetical protein
VIGSLVNAGCILLAGAAVWLCVPVIPAAAQRRVQALLAVLSMGVGFHVMWRGLHGPFGHAVRQLVILGVALVWGSGQGLGIQAR